jgi:hypothetical protein
VRRARGALRLAAAAATLLAVPTLAETPVWSAAVGAGYSRTDSVTTNPQTSVSQAVPLWEALGNAEATWVPFRPGLLSLDGGVDYRHYQQYGDQAASRSDNLTYRAGAAVLSDGPLTLDLGAARRRSDFSADLGATQTGSTTSDDQRAGLALRGLDLPRLTANYTRNRTENLNFGGLRSSSSSDVLGVAASQGLNAFDYTAIYDTAWSRGSFADLNYRSHRLDLQASARPADGVEMRVSDGWIQRLPDSSRADITNPLYEGNAFNAGATWRRGRGLLLGVSYGDARFALARPTVDRVERHTQNAGQLLQYDVAPEWTLLETLTVSRNDDTVGADSIRAFGQSLAAGARWARARDETRYAVELLASGGYLRPDTGGTFAGAGASLDLQYALVSPARRWAAGLRTSFNSNLQGREGWDLSNDGYASLASEGGPGLRAELRLDLSQAITRTALFGQRETRLVRLQGVARYVRVTLRAAAGLSEGLADLANQGALPGIPVLPDKLKTRTAYAQGQAEAAFWRTGLSGLASLNWLRNSSPGRPNTDEVGLSVALVYNLGLFTLSLEDRYTIGSVENTVVKVNYLFARVTRNFGSK